MRIYGGSTMPSQLMAAITPSISCWLDPEGRMYLLDRWRKQAHPTNGSKRSVILCLSGSRSAGLRRRVRSVPALDLLSISAKESERLLLSPAVPDQGRQGGKSPVHSGPHGS
jgi:hypothetical protein